MVLLCACFTANAQTPPTVTVSPAGPTARVVGTLMTFALKATGSPVPTYQWLFNGGPILDATNTSYTIPHVQPSDEGSYSAYVYNGDEAYSDPSDLIVVTPPSIVTQPVPPADPIIDGDSYTFTVEATGTADLAYQWRFNGANLLGETDASIVATRAGVYSVRVSNSLYPTITPAVISSNATLAVWFPPQITTQPISRTALATKTTSFIVTVNANASKPLHYQWLHDEDEIPGATTNYYTIASPNSTDAGIYKVHVWNETNSIYQETYSEPAELVVLVPPKILAQPISQTANPGEDIIFAVDIQDDATWPLVYQWRFNGVNIDEGGDGETLYLPNVDESNIGLYSIVVTNPAGFVISASASLAVRRPPLISGQPVDVRAGFGTNVAFAVKASGTGPLNYQWMFNDNLVAGATNSSIIFRAASTNQNGLYSVFISNLVDVVTSTPAQLTVIAETILPSVIVTNPSLAFTTVTNSTFNLAGKASDNIGVAKVLYQLNSTPYTAASGTVHWGASLELTPGTNVVRVKSIDTSGNTSLVATRTIFYSVKSLLTLLTNGGPGTISAPVNRMLEINRAYTITATPGVGEIFANWTGTITSNTAALRFMMQSNMVLQANFIPDPFRPRKGVYNGLFYETNGVRQISSGGFTMTLFEKGGASGKVNMGGVSYTFTNRFDFTGLARFDVLRLNQTPLKLTLRIDVTNMTDEVSGTVSNSTWRSTLLADRNIFAKTNPAPFAGIYSMVIPGQTNAGVPPGDGYGVVTVDAAGTVRLLGALADGTSIAQGTTISKNGDFPLYVPLYTGKGFILSWLTLANSNSVAGDLSWFRATNSLSKLYPLGFTNLISLEGGIFAKPAKGTRVLNFTNGIVSLRGGNLSNDITATVVLTTNNTLVISSTNRVALTLNTTNGVITGSFIHPKTKLSTPIKGSLVRQQNQGRGFFLGTNQGGIFSLQSN